VHIVEWPRAPVTTVASAVLHVCVEIERLLPTFDAIETHSIVVGAGPERSYLAIHSFDLADSWLSTVLLSIRRGRPTRPPRLCIGDILRRGGFVLLAEEPGREIVLGTVGRFWRMFGGGVRIQASEFASYASPGTAKSAINFRVEPLADGRTRVSTQTRVLCIDEPARRAFRRYWRIIAPGSALIRLEMLRLIKRDAERATA